MSEFAPLLPHLSKVKIPGPQQKVYKDECVFSFDDPESNTGLYVSLNSFLGFGREYVDQYYNFSGNPIFLHIKREKKLIPPVEQKGDGPEKKITRLAIGVEGGFDTEGQKKYDIVEHMSIVLLPEHTVFSWPNENLPEIIIKSVEGVLKAESPLRLAEIESLAGTWDGEVRKVSAYASNLKQLDNGVKIPPTGWKCEKCDLTQNLWLNLTDGSILCGRKFFDGSGGNDHAMHHYQQTSYPLAVKLGTITPDGKGDVFSYAEDDMVEDPNLVDHLKHFGINTQNLQKTEKSMVELELEINQRAWEWGALQESSSALQPAQGPGLTGLLNLGNSCYLNSVMQVIFTIPSFIKRFVDEASTIFSAFPSDPVNDFNVQLAKLGVGLVSGRYSCLTDDGSQKGVSPTMFKTLIGKGHPEFSTKRQQDAQEFYMHLLDILQRNSRHSYNPSSVLKMNVEERVECGETGQVNYSHRTEYCLSLPVPLAAASNRAEVEAYEQERRRLEDMGQRMDPSQLVRPQIPFKACTDAFSQEEIVEQFFSTAVNRKVTAKKSTKLATFPEYLVIQLKKFTLRSDWVPIKLDVGVDMPWEMELSELRGTGIKPSEVPLPQATVDIPPPSYDEATLSQLMDIGFPPEACKRAMFFTKNTSTEAAINWLMEHIADNDFDKPFVPPGTDTSQSAVPKPNESDVEMIMAMGFTRQQAEKALKATQNNVERAADWIFSHATELDAEDSPQEEQGPKKEEFTDGSGKYKLVGFISHMGTSTQVGHYVCHILHEDRWVIFNDNKVAFSENPPKDLGYLYLYQRLS